MEGGLEYKRGLWTAEEDKILLDYIKVHGQGRWNRVSKVTGLKRRGKSCRLRWMNYLSPSVKRGDFSEQEDDLIIRLHNLLGNRWSLIAGRVPGRTDNQVKNYWNTHLSKKLGIKNTGRRAKAPSHVPTAQEGKNPNGLEPERNSNPHLGMEGEQEGKKDETQPAIESDGQQELFERAGSYDYSFWFSNDDLEDLCIPNFMEVGNDYSLDLFGMEWGAYNFSSQINE